MRLVPMKDMLYRDGLLRWVTDRMRRGTTDRAGGLTEPLQRLCDGCQLPSSYVHESHGMPIPSLHIGSSP